MPEHNTLTGSSLHEPKGVDSANANEVYVSDGVGSGSWVEKNLISPVMWDDLTSSLIARRLSGTSGTLQYNYANNSITMQPSGVLGTPDDTLTFNYQWPHGALLDGEMRLHIHWEQPDSQAYVFSGQYRVQQNGVLKNTTWTPFTVTVGSGRDAFSYVSGTLNQITRLVEIDMTGFNISSTVELQLTRTDALTGNIEAVFVDAHIPFDTHGSRQEYIK